MAARITCTPARVGLATASASLLFLAACNLPLATRPPADEGQPTLTPFQPENLATMDPGPGEEETPTWWIAPELPARLRDQLALPPGAEVVGDREGAQLSIMIGDGEPIVHWVYALVAPFPTLTDEVSLEDVRALWRGEGERPLLVSPETDAVFSAWWGPSAGIEVLPADELLDAAWAADAWALVPFEALQPRWKVLVVEGQSPVRKTFDAASYALSVPVGLAGEAELLQSALGDWAQSPVSNRDPGQLTTVAVTGVTALVRATAYEMDRSGVTYPTEEIGALLAGADITHISNEVPFWPDCPPPDPVQRGLRFCSDPDYIELLEVVGADVVELTGDHFNDHGQEPMLYTLDLYDQHGMLYYGGGRTLEEGRQAAVLEHNGNRLAFIGCNGKSGYATASETLAGAVQCDYDWLAAEVARLRDEGYIVIATFQHNEVYTFVPQPTLIRDFAVPAQAGASIVSGSQAHQSHGMAFPDADTLITYGLGNLFFDQLDVVEHGEKALIAMHVIYAGRYISTELYTIQFVDFAKPRFMTLAERADFLNTLFSASLWND